MNIVMLEPLGVPEELLRQKAAPLERAGHTVTICTEKLTEEEKLRRAAGADVFIIANGKLTEKVIAAAPDLKMISVGFTGIDHVDLAACRARGVRVCNAQGYATEATAELALSLMLACLRHLLPYDAAVRHGGTAAGYANRTLRGKTVGILGTGAIGKRVAELARPFGCELLGASRSVDPEAETLGIRYVPVEELFRESDIVTVHVPLNEWTRGLVSRERIDSMKKSAILINCARGGVVDREALADALNQGRIAAAGLDVFYSEPPIPADEPLLTAKNTVLTPHTGFLTEEAMAARLDIVFENVTAWLAGAPVNVKL